MCFFAGMLRDSHCIISDSNLVRSGQNEAVGGDCSSLMFSKYKKRRMLYNGDVGSLLPTLYSSDYFTKPSIDELAALEMIDSGYCSRVPDFTIGRVGYGQIKFIGSTDVRWLHLDQIVKFDRNSVVVYTDEADKPPVGQGLNKAAEVTLTLKLRSLDAHSLEVDRFGGILRKRADRQGAFFVSFDLSSGNWTFLVHHFSRFGLDDEEEEDIVMIDNDIDSTAEVKEFPAHSAGTVLSHSLPAHLGLDPVRMQELRALMFSAEEEYEDLNGSFQKINSYNKEQLKEDSPVINGKILANKTTLHGSSRKGRIQISSSPIRRPSQALLEYNLNNTDLSPSRDIFLSGQRKGLPLTRLTKVEGFRLEEKHQTPLSGGYSKNIVDAALFMGRSFRVGWGPNGILVHSGTPVGSPSCGLSSQVNIQKVAMDKTVRDKNNKINEELVDLHFSSLMNLHKSVEHETSQLVHDSFKLKLLRVECSRLTLPEICQAYIETIEKAHDISELSTSNRVFLMHQVSIWALIRILFSERETNEQSNDDDREGMMLDTKDDSLDMDVEAKPFARRAEFSFWLQESVCHRVQDEITYLNDSSDLEQILVLLTGRQLDAAVELAAARGDVRLAILLSQAGGSVVSRSDMAQQLDIWRMNGMDFKFIENDRLKLYELLAGNIQDAFQVSSIDWKRFLGLIMWYQLPPDTPLSVVFHTYQQLLCEKRAPHPVPVYIDEGPLEEEVDWNIGDNHDLAYYVMLLHANEDNNFNQLKTMFSAFSSTYDPLDYHMIWHQRAILEAIGTFSSKDLSILDMSFVDQLLCLGLCHWAIYVVLHMPYCDNAPYIQAKLIKQILCQNCEIWSSQEIQYQFIEELGVPSEWMHEALVWTIVLLVQYTSSIREICQRPWNIFLDALIGKKLTQSSLHQWLIAYSYHVTQDEEIWRITSFMEEHKSEIADWDLGAGIYFDFYILRSSLKEGDIMSETDPLGKKNDECRSFFTRLSESLLIWGSRLPADARLTYAKMSEELCNLLMSIPGLSSTAMVRMSCFDTMLIAPTPEDMRSSHLQSAVSDFTYFLSEIST
ncbi:hypothetical protein ZIOFF_023900 [Zingiber officinale]|uniref:Peptidase S59 domain-containing protein n=2 Tax=Zingiber officinale TaxID=94328 RepID=A0A8J5GXG3_ZINOF|nr:hypothetical protein ZIOFF_023900 [Zingiber officinale]